VRSRCRRTRRLAATAVAGIDVAAPFLEVARRETDDLEHPEKSEEPTCGPRPFSMADADTVSKQLRIAGFEQIRLLRSDLPLRWVPPSMTRSI
jgi:hypothetical protein